MASVLAVGGPRYFYPRSPCGERLRRALAVSAGQGISIHALLAESDVLIRDGFLIDDISIHALLAESEEANLS